MKQTIAVLTAAGLINLTWDAAAKAFNYDHEDKADPGFALVQSTSTSGITIIVQHGITGDEIEVPKVFELKRIGRRT
jgi:hypothetical protein